MATTVSANSQTAHHDWYVVDASNKVLGRLATEIARRLRGKHKVEFTPHVDTGDFIVVINADKVRLTSLKKAENKHYYHHTGYPGGMKSINFNDLLASKPERVIETAVKGMLPKNSLGRSMYKKLKVYSGNEHPHAAQQPKELKIEDAE